MFVKDDKVVQNIDFIGPDGELLKKKESIVYNNGTSVTIEKAPDGTI